MEEVRVLIVDDSVVQRNHVVTLCQQQQHSIMTIDDAENGLLALEKLRLHKYDLVFIDLEMPIMDGVELVRRIADENLAESVIILSSKDPSLILSIGAMAEADGLFVVGTFQKPLKEADLSASFTRFFKGSSQEETTEKHKALVFEKQDFVRGIEEKEFKLAYQPKLSVKGLLLKGAEALARWDHPTRGRISPVEFIAAAEGLGVISLVTFHLFESALKQKVIWKEHGINIHLSFNLSPLSLTDTGLADSIEQLVNSYAISPSELVLEITENAISGEVSTAIETLAKLRLKGFNLAIDDYGTGFANAQQLSRIPATELKVDRSLVDNVATNPQQQSILKSTVSLSKELRLVTVAEGVEYFEDFQYLLSLDVELVQGYYFAKPMMPEELMVWIKSGLSKLRKQTHDLLDKNT
jgi:EAL domain-containing protein (putative c-di-GMP-specific phosphodiesterase class I)/AmiR/NasT family two-component response regulator